MSRVPVIALTAHDPEDVRQLVSSAGCTDFVTKPVNFSTLVALISKYLSM